MTLRRLSEALGATDLRAVDAAQLEAKLAALEADTPALRDLETASLSDPRRMAAVVEAIKKRETVRKVMGLFREETPLLYEALVGERDRFMAGSLLRGAAGGTTTVAVVGVAHAEGIEAALAAAGWRAASCELAPALVPQPPPRALSHVG